MSTKSIKQRVQARELAVQALYQVEIARRGTTPIQTIDDLEPFLQSAAREADVRALAREIVDGVLGRSAMIDDVIRRAAEHWKLERIALVDRSILRVAVYELLEDPEIPPKVAIDAAIELAKKFSTAQSGAFVNGILDRIYRDSRAGSPATD